MSQQFALKYQDTPVVLVSPQLLIFISEASFWCQKRWWTRYIKESQISIQLKFAYEKVT